MVLLVQVIEGLGRKPVFSPVIAILADVLQR
jgi:hypothetical protein